MSRYAVLGMLTGGPRSGYDIRREIGTSVRHFWSESYGQVYPVLHDLVRNGLATVAVEPGGGPNRKVYTLTGAGIAELRDWLARPVEPQPSRNELLLKLFFGRFIPDADLLRVVQDVRDRWVTDMVEWAEIAARMRSKDAEAAQVDPDRRDRLRTLRYGQLVGEATVRWADEIIAELTARPASAQGEER